MTGRYDRLPYPARHSLTALDSERLAHELTIVGEALRERARLLLATGYRGVELAVVELDDAATRVLHRAHHYAPNSPTAPTFPITRLAE